MSKRQTFVDRAVAGKVFNPDAEVDDEIEEWHSLPKADVSLSTWLGMSRDEYALFVESPALLTSILHARRYDVDVVTVARDGEREFQLAARGLDRAEVAKVKTWLKQTKRL